MNPLYNAGIRLYSSAAHVAALGSAKVRHMLHGQAETIARLKSFRRQLAPGGFDLWLHAASLGEFEQGRPIIDAVLAAKPDTKILLSFFSPSGYEVRCNYDPRVAVVYMPFDLPGNVGKFLDIADPKMAIFIKYEFWGNYLGELKRRGIPTYIVSAIFRPSQMFFKPWGGMFRKMLACFEHIYVQDGQSRSLLAGIGVDNVTVAGDTRFDRVTAVREKRRDIPEVEIFKAAHPGAFTMVFGSSWEKDEDVYVPDLTQRENVCAIIAPHEFDKDRLSAMRRRLGSDRTMLFSDFARLAKESPGAAAKAAAGLRYLIVDCYGLLSSLYRYADAAYVGGGFGVGIHNINEAAVYGIPVVFGPNFAKFNEAVELTALEGAFSIDNTVGFAAILDRIIGDKDFRAATGQKAADYIASKVGATPIIMKSIFKSKN